MNDIRRGRLSLPFHRKKGTLCDCGLGIFEFGSRGLSRSWLKLFAIVLEKFGKPPNPLPTKGNLSLL
jgi:hypothetical protein